MEATTDATTEGHGVRSSLYEVCRPFRRLATATRVREQSKKQSESLMGVESLPIGRMRS